MNFQHNKGLDRSHFLEADCRTPVREETGPNGPGNIPEFGSVKTEEGFKGLYETSAYYHVEPGTKYPGVLVTAGANGKCALYSSDLLHGTFPQAEELKETDSAEPTSSWFAREETALSSAKLSPEDPVLSCKMTGLCASAPVYYRDA
jgi:hypothetical protein